MLACLISLCLKNKLMSPNSALYHVSLTKNISFTLTHAAQVFTLFQASLYVKQIDDNHDIVHVCVERPSQMMLNTYSSVRNTCNVIFSLNTQ